MGFYEEWILPPLIDLSMRNKRLRPYRERVAGAAEGRVLDVGIGSGLNLPFYAGQVREIFGLDPSPPLLARAQRQTPHMEIPFHLLEGSAERIPLADRSMDTIVDVDRLQHSRDQDCSRGHAARAQDRWATAVRGAWTRAGTECRPLAGSPRSALAEVLGRVPPQPQDRRPACRSGLSARPAGNRLYRGTEDHDVPVRRGGVAALTRPQGGPVPSGLQAKVRHNQPFRAG